MRLFNWGKRKEYTETPDYEGLARVLRRFLIRQQVVPIDDNPSAYINQAFSKNPTVFSVIMMRAYAAKAISWVLYRKVNQQKFRQYKAMSSPGLDLKRATSLKSQALEEIDDHPIKRLMTAPNNYQSFEDFIEAMFIFRDVTGNAYAYKTINETTGDVASLHVLPADKVRIMGGTFTSPVESYIIDLWDGKLEPEKVMHWKFYNTRWGSDGRDLYGMSPLRPAAGIIAQDNVSIDSQSAALLNEGLKGIITGTDQTQIDFTREQAEEIKKRFEKSSGFKNKNKIQFNRAPLQWLKIGESPADLGALEVRRLNKEMMCNIFRIHPSLLSSDASTLNNLKEARKALMTMSVLPDVDSLKDHLNRHIAAPYGDEYYIDYDLMSVTEMQDDLTKISEMLGRMDWLTDNEKRAATDYERYESEAADKIYKQAGLLPIDNEFDTGFDLIDANL